jgi:hypothetical protein
MNAMRMFSRRRMSVDNAFSISTLQRAANPPPSALGPRLPQDLFTPKARALGAAPLIKSRWRLHFGEGGVRFERYLPQEVGQLA